MLSLTMLSVGCGDHTSAFLTEPPQMPPGYGISYTLPEGGAVMRKRNPKAVLWDENPVPFNVLRVGVEKGVIFGIREDPTTKRQSAFYVDTNANTATLDIPVAELDRRLKDRFGIANTDTVPARFYDRNADGGPR
jgi:hypothetical protein